jgi:phosphomannomutase
MTYSPSIFRSYDIRGIVPDELDLETAEKIGHAFVLFTKAKTILVGRDMRVTGPSMETALIKGLTSQGANVIKVGMVTTPMFYYSVWHSGADAGVMVSASHNPGKYNGFKMTLAQAVPISKDTGLLEIRALAEKGDFPVSETVGTISEADYADGYLDYVLKEAGPIGKIKIVIDSGNGMCGKFLPQLLEKLPQLEVTRMYFEPDGNFPNHEADPLKESNLVDLRKMLLTEKAQLGVAFDGDGDRVGFMDEKGVPVTGDFIGSLIAQELLKVRPGSKILYDLRSSWATKDAIEQFGGIAVPERVGHSFIKAAMRREKAIFAAELSSHFFFDEYYAESGMRAMILVLRIMSETKKTLSELVAPLRKYAKTPEINFIIQDKEAAIEEARKRFADGKQNELDGLFVEYSDWWFNLRPSGTEPLLRLNMEAKTQELLEQKKQELYSFLGQPVTH